MRSTPRRNLQLLCRSIYLPKKLTNKAILHGIEFEKKAIAQLETKQDLKVQECGLLIREDMPFIAATPDGVCGDRIVEVKCPYKGRNEKICKNLKFFPYLDQDKDGHLILKKSHIYYAQVQGELLISKKRKAIFVIFTFVDFVTISVQLDDHYCKNILVPRLKRFFTKYYRPYIASLL